MIREERKQIMDRIEDAKLMMKTYWLTFRDEMGADNQLVRELWSSQYHIAKALGEVANIELEEDTPF